MNFILAVVKRNFKHDISLKYFNNNYTKDDARCKLVLSTDFPIITSLVSQCQYGKVPYQIFPLFGFGSDFGLDANLTLAMPNRFRKEFLLPGCSSPLLDHNLTAYNTNVGVTIAQWLKCREFEFNPDCLYWLQPLCKV